ncbi:lipid kinase, YegS/Rv2252/BmrU family [Paracoccus alcaliphilus]|uniref:Lipid kinase, YegS/Rv2252/BmrU family n=1 Tax=Paracoccus alcaliphilus TaxID=34002 RepID=A0A1H8DZ38_9RHOB|nr:diacylglycerol kinase family protein [Paracoccus alcaliphilus]WCR16876.1 diacylglycerol kinase [Paracoccus alcaliphilus]SEN11797.1 lipid kinase, YegS/Rv2252/BmrU family [Paracoccus alcaliphilus]
MQQDKPFDLSRTRACVIFNHSSGSKDDAVFRQTVTDALSPHLAGLEWRVTENGGDLAGLARSAVSDGFDLVIAAGGDGTQSAVAGALAGTDAVMAVLPGGTFNYFARDLGVGETLEDALDTIRDSVARPVDLGWINDLIFLNNVSFGAYPHILKTREGIYRRWGRSRIAAYWSVLVALRRLRRPMQITARVDGEEQHFSTALIFVAKSAYQLDVFGLDGADAIRGGRFAVLIAKAKRPMPLMRSALRLAVGRSAKDSDFDLIVTDELTIDTRKRTQLVAHDGEKTRMQAPFRLKVLHDALRVLLPADGQSKTEGAE